MLFVELDSDEWELNIYRIIPETEQNIDLIWRFKLFKNTFVKLLATSRITLSQKKGNHILIKNASKHRLQIFKMFVYPTKICKIVTQSFQSLPNSYYFTSCFLSINTLSSCPQERSLGFSIFSLLAFHFCVFVAADGSLTYFYIPESPSGT